MQADSCVSTEIGIFLFFCAATFCHSCMRNMQLVWMSLLNRLTCGQVDQVGLLLRVDDLPSVVVQMALGVVGNFDLRLVTNYLLKDFLREKLWGDRSALSPEQKFYAVLLFKHSDWLLKLFYQSEYLTNCIAYNCDAIKLKYHQFRMEKQITHFVD